MWLSNGHYQFCVLPLLRFVFHSQFVLSLKKFSSPCCSKSLPVNQLFPILCGPWEIFPVHSKNLSIRSTLFFVGFIGMLWTTYHLFNKILVSLSFFSSIQISSHLTKLICVSRSTLIRDLRLQTIVFGSVFRLHGSCLIKTTLSR